MLEMIADVVDEATLKKCTICHKTLPLTEFYSDKKNKDGLRYDCKKCGNAANLKWLNSLSEEEQLARRKKFREWREKNPEKNLLYTAKKRAIKKGLVCDIEISDIIIPKVCPLLGIPLFVAEYIPTEDVHKPVKNYISDNSPTLDRINPNLGYIKENIWVISNKANRIKNDATLDDLKMLCSNWEKIESQKDMYRGIV